MENYIPPIAKASGKESAFILWLNAVGRKKFLQVAGHNYSARSPADKDAITKIFKQLSPEELQYYKNKENSEHNSTENRAKRRYATERFRRAEAHKNPFGEFECRSQFDNLVNSEEGATFRAHPHPVQLPPIEPLSKPNSMYQHDMELICEQRQNEIFHHYRDFNKELLMDELFTFVGVSTTFVYKETMYSCMYPIPVELSVVNFTFRSGIRDSVSFHLNVDAGVIIDPNWIGRKQMTEIRKKAQEFMPYYSMETQAEPSTDHDDLRVVWRRFKNAWADNGQQKAILLCEKEIYNQVTATLRIAASGCGQEEEEFFKENIEQKILPMENFALSMRDASEKQIADERIGLYFQETVIPTSEMHFCPEFHRKLPKKNFKRFICQEARGAMAIFKLYKCLHYENLFGFTRYLDGNVHFICEIANENQKKLVPKLNPDTFLQFNPRATNKKGSLQSWALPKVEEELPSDRHGIRIINKKFKEEKDDSEEDTPVIRGNFRSNFVYVSSESDDEKDTRRPSSSSKSSRAEGSPQMFRRDPHERRETHRSFDGPEASGRNWARDPGGWRSPPRSQGNSCAREYASQRSPTRSQEYSRGSNHKTAPPSYHSGRQLQVVDSDDDDDRRRVYGGPRDLGHLPSYASACPSRAGSIKPSPDRYRRPQCAPPKHDRIARVLDEVLDSDEEADKEVDELCNRTRSNSLSEPPRRKNPRQKPQDPAPMQAGPRKPRHWPVFRWRIVSNDEIRKLPLWYSKEKAAFNPFDED